MTTHSPYTVTTTVDGSIEYFGFGSLWLLFVEDEVVDVLFCDQFVGNQKGR